MDNMDNLYSVLKATRDGIGNKEMQNKHLRDYILEHITKKDIQNMDKRDLQEAVIDYIEAVLPDFK